MKKLSFIFVLLCGWAVSNLNGQSRSLEIGRDGYGHPVVFEFKSNYLTYLGYYTWNRQDRQFDNRSLIEEYSRVIDNNMEDIRAGKTKVHVRGYFTSRASKEENLNAARHSSNEVKSWFIVHEGLKEDHYQTKNYALPFNDEGYDAVVLFLGPVDIETPPMPAFVVVFVDGEPIAAGSGVSDITPVRGELAFRRSILSDSYMHNMVYSDGVVKSGQKAQPGAVSPETSVSNTPAGEGDSYSVAQTVVKEPQSVSSNQAGGRGTASTGSFGTSSQSSGSSTASSVKNDISQFGEGVSESGRIGSVPAASIPASRDKVRKGDKDGYVPQTGVSKERRDRKDKEKVRDNSSDIVLEKQKTTKPTYRREDVPAAAVNKNTVVRSGGEGKQSSVGSSAQSGSPKQLSAQAEGTTTDGLNEYVGFAPVGTPVQNGKSPDRPGLSKKPRKPMIYREIYPRWAIKTDIMPWIGFQPSFQPNNYSFYSFVPNIEVEYFFADRYSVAAQGEYMKRPQRNDRYFGRSAWSAEPRFWIKSDGRFRWFYVGLYGELGDFDNFNNYLPEDKGKTGMFFGGGLAAGVYIPVDPRIGIEVGLRGGYTRWEVDDYSYEEPIYYLDERSRFGTWGLTEVKVAVSYRFGRSFVGRPPASVRKLIK